MVILLEKNQNSLAIQALRNENVLGLMEAIVQPARSYGVVMQSHAYNLEKYNGDAIDYNNMVISVMLWAKNILEVDEFSKELGEKLLRWQDENNTHFWDYNIESFLEENGYDEHYEEKYSCYTYNDPDSCYLDRDIHYTLFNYDGDYYVCFSVHHGADARVGFSDSVILKVKDFDYFFLSMEITAYNSVTDDDISVWELEDIAEYNHEEKAWFTKEGNQEIYIHSSANGY